MSETDIILKAIDTLRDDFREDNKDLKGDLKDLTNKFSEFLETQIRLDERMKVVEKKASIPPPAKTSKKEYAALISTTSAIVTGILLAIQQFASATPLGK
jgi:chromosome segregation ATPase